MKKRFMFTVVLLILALTLCSCGGNEDSEAGKSTATAGSTPTAKVTATPTKAPEPTPTEEPTEAPTETPTEVHPDGDTGSSDSSLTQLDIGDIFIEETSSSYESPGEGWCADFAIDGDYGDEGNGWSTSPHGEEDGDAYIILGFDGEQEVGQVKLWPRQSIGDELGLYFPIAYEIDVSSDGENWTNVASKEGDYGSDENDDTPRVIDFTPVKCKYIRVHGTELTDYNPMHADGLMMQFAEIEVFVVKK